MKALPASRLGWFAIGALIGSALTRLLNVNAREAFASLDSGLGSSDREVDTAMETVSPSAGSMSTLPLTDETVPDRVLIYRVRQTFPLIVRNPRSVHVSADQGEVTLYGSLYRDELNELVTAVQDVQGVKNLVNNLRVFDLPEETEAGTSADESPSPTH